MAIEKISEALAIETFTTGMQINEVVQLPDSYAHCDSKFKDFQIDSSVYEYFPDDGRVN